METAESDQERADYDQEKTEEDESAAKIGHSENALGGGQKGGGLAKKLGWLAGFGENAEGAAELDGLLAHTFEVGVKAGKDEDVATWQLPRHVVDQVETVASGHGDVAEQEMGGKRSGADQSIIRGINCLRFKAALSEDERECVGYETVIINDQDPLHSDLLEIPSTRRPLPQSAIAHRLG
jgi:hypothetical protein